MGQTTLRDQVWMFVVARCIKKGQAVEPAEIADSTGASERMVRQCLLSILNSGLIERRSNADGEVQYIPAREINWQSG